jgi:hypothetical protein
LRKFKISDSKFQIQNLKTSSLKNGEHKNQKTMPIQFDKFDQQKVDRLKSHLLAQAQKGQAKFYEIFVDSLKAVQKTDEPSEFEGYEDYMTADTRQIKVIIYNSGLSPRNDQFVFSLNAASPKEALESALDGFTWGMLSKPELQELKIKRDNHLAESFAIKKLEQEAEELNAEIEEKNEYILQLEAGIEKAKANGNKLGGVDLGLLLTEGLDGLIRKNTHLISRVTGLDGIAKMIDEDTQAQNQAFQNTSHNSSFNSSQNTGHFEANGAASFSKKPNTNSEAANINGYENLSENEMHFLNLFKKMQERFSEQEIYEVIVILDRMSEDKSLIEPIIVLLDKNTSNT